MRLFGVRALRCCLLAVLVDIVLYFFECLFLQKKEETIQLHANSQKRYYPTTSIGFDTAGGAADGAVKAEVGAVAVAAAVPG